MQFLKLINLLFMPLVGAITAGLFGFYFGRIGSYLITITTTFLSFLMSVHVLQTSQENEQEFMLYIGQWIHSGLFDCDWAFIFDSLSLIMLCTITGISTLVHIFSINYMETDPHVPRFMSYLSLFTFFMIILVTGDNFIVLFVGWEGVGFCSFLLINFWHTRIQANKAAIKAMLVNRVSDLLLLLGIVTIFWNIRTVEYFSTFATISALQGYGTIICNTWFPAIDAICILILLGCMGKSAQVGFHVWLPDAMEGPTPVSALIHAATMVTAGVYLVVRCSPIFELSPFSSEVMTYVGGITAFLGASIALSQNDFKKIIAYSTCSQIGYMFIACGVSNYAGAIYHLSNHAWFKALLFLCSGAVIHTLGEEQDIRKMGGLRRPLPFTYVMFLIGSLSLMGVPFLSGFYSKEFILEGALATYTPDGHFAYWLGTIGAYMTSFYSFRLIFFVFLTETNANKNVIKNVHDVPLFMGIPLGILALGSMFSGYLTRDMFIGLGTDFWNNSIYVSPINNHIIDAEFLSPAWKNLPILASFSGVFSAFYLYVFQFRFLYDLKMSVYGLPLYNFLNRKWYFDKIYTEFINQKVLSVGYTITYKMIDKGVIEMCGPFGLTRLISSFSDHIIKLQTGYIYNYSLIMFVSIILLILMLFLSIFTFMDLSIIFFLFLFYLFLNA